MKINKLTFITISSFSQRDYDRFGVDILKKSGFAVEVLDISCVLFKNEFISIDGVEITPIYSYEMFAEIIANNTNDVLYIMLFGESSKLLTINLILSKYNARTMLFNANSLPVSVSKQSLLGRIKYIISTFEFLGIYQKVKYILFKHKINNYDYVLVGGSNSLKCDRVDENTRFIFGHTLDYDIFLDQKDVIPLVDYKYAVFLDEYLPYHSDGDIINRSTHLKSIAKVYYPTLNKFFSFIEQKYNLKVIIASHPRAEYEKIGYPYDGRKCVGGKTNQLVKYAEFCIGHFSTSINFSVIHKKPIIFITMKEVDYLFSEFIKTFARKLGKVKIYIENIEKINDIDLDVNEDLYNRYMREYIKDINECKNTSKNWEIVAQYLIEHE